MRFFKYSDPFSALIVAESREKANEIYSKEVCFDEGTDGKADPSQYVPKELSEDEARAWYDSVLDADNFDKRLKNLQNDEIFLIDAELC